MMNEEEQASIIRKATETIKSQYVLIAALSKRIEALEKENYELLQFTLHQEAKIEELDSFIKAGEQ